MGLGRENAPFPISFLSFDAYTRGEVVEVRWITTTEVNSDFFVVQRSLDGIHFEAAAVVQAAGNSLTQIRYASTDNSPFSGRSYYRVVETDLGGNTTATNVVEVNFAAQARIEFIAYPNPTTRDHVQVLVSGAGGEQMLMRMVDLLGNVYSEETIKIDAESYIYTYPMKENLATGMYLLEGSGIHGSKSAKVFVQ